VRSGDRSPLVSVSTPGLQKQAFFPPPFPIMTRKPDRERDTERRRDQRRLHPERLAVVARCTCFCHITGCPPRSTSAPPRGEPALPVSKSCAPPAGQGPPVAGGAWVPPPNATPNQGGGNWPAGRDGRHCRRAAAGAGDQGLIPTKVADIWEGERDGRRCRRVTRRCRRLPAWTIKPAAVGSNRPRSVFSSRRPLGAAVPTRPRVWQPGTGLAGQGRISPPRRVGAAGLSRSRRSKTRWPRRQWLPSQSPAFTEAKLGAAGRAASPSARRLLATERGLVAAGWPSKSSSRRPRCTPRQLGVSGWSSKSSIRRPRGAPRQLGAAGRSRKSSIRRLRGTPRQLRAAGTSRKSSSRRPRGTLKQLGAAEWRTLPDRRL